MHFFRALGVEVRVLKADEAFPDCVFVEDPAIVIEGHALITKPGDPSRQDEIRRIRRTLRDELQLPFLEGIDDVTPCKHVRLQNKDKSE